MAESVQAYLETMIPELEDLERRKIFTSEEIKSIVKQRTDYEYKLKRRIKQKIDFLRYIEYEMNLDALRMIRIKKAAGGGRIKKTISTYSGQRRIQSIFDRALYKFSGDINLWFQYIDFCKKNKSGKLLNQIFARAIRAHNRCPDLWISAASWEMEENMNMSGARALMQRGLRVNNDSKELWLQYCKLELIFTDKIKARQAVLGIDTLKEKNSDSDNHENEEARLNSECISIPKMEEENVECNFEEIQGDHSNSIISFAIPRAVYRNAISTIPKDIDFRLEFLKLFRMFEGTEEAMEEIYNSIKQDFPDDMYCFSLFAQRHVTCLNPNTDSSFPAQLKVTLKEYQESKEIATPEGSEAFLTFLCEYAEKCYDTTMKTIFFRLFLESFKVAVEKDLATEKSYLLYIQQMGCIDGKKEDVIEKINEGLSKYPLSVSLWNARIATTKDSSSCLIQEALLCVQQQSLEITLPLWLTYLNYLNKYDYEKEEASKFIDFLLSFPFPIQNDIFPRFLRLLFGYGVEIVRQVYSDYFRRSPNRSSSIIHCCLDLETAAYQSNNFFNEEMLRKKAKINQKKNVTEHHVRAMYTMATEHSPKDMGLWLNFIKFELVSKQHNNASTLYWKASKCVPDPEEFGRRYNEMVNN